MFAYWFQTAETLRDIISKAFWFCSVYIRFYSYFSSVSKVKFLIHDILKSLKVHRGAGSFDPPWRNTARFETSTRSPKSCHRSESCSRSLKDERFRISDLRKRQTCFFFKYHKKFKYKKQLIVGMRNHLQWRFLPFLEKVRSKVKAIKKCKTRSCWKCFWSFAGGVSPEKVTLTFHLVTLSYYGHPNLWILLCKRHREV